MRIVESNKNTVFASCAPVSAFPPYHIDFGAETELFREAPANVTVGKLNLVDSSHNLPNPLSTGLMATSLTHESLGQFRSPVFDFRP